MLLAGKNSREYCQIWQSLGVRMKKMESWIRERYPERVKEIEKKSALERLKKNTPRYAT